MDILSIVYLTTIGIIYSFGFMIYSELEISYVVNARMILIIDFD